MSTYIHAQAHAIFFNQPTSILYIKMRLYIKKSNGVLYIYTFTSIIDAFTYEKQSLHKNYIAKTQTDK